MKKPREVLLPLCAFAADENVLVEPPFPAMRVERESDRERSSECCSALKIVVESCPELQIRSKQLAREGSPPSGLLHLEPSCHANPMR